MTTIKYAKTSRRFLLTAEGHTGYAPYGKDIVCAAISTLISTLQFSAHNLSKHNQLQILKFQLGDESADISLQYDEPKIATYCFKPFIDSLIALSKQYSDNVSVEEFSVSEFRK